MPDSSKRQRRAHKPPDPEKLSPRDQKALDALARLRPQASRAERLRTSSLSWKQWRAALASLVARGLVVRTERDRAMGEADTCALTERGRAQVGTGRAQVEGTGTGFGSSPQSLGETEERNNEPTTPVPEGTGQTDEGHRSRAQVTGPLDVRVVHELGPETLARLDALAEAVMASLSVRAAVAPVVAQAAPSSAQKRPQATTRRKAPDGSPICDCDEPMKLKPRNDGSGDFWSCRNWAPGGAGCGVTLGVDWDATGPTTPDLSEAARKERDEHRKRVEDERKARQKADDEAHAKHLREMASKVKQAAKGGTSGADLLKVLRGEQGQGVA